MKGLSDSYRKKMNNKPILFYDSGIGGLPYLQVIRESLPYEDYIYFADNKSFPFGTKPEAILLPIFIQSLQQIYQEFNPKVIIIACNTASVVALDKIRESVLCPVIGTVPAIKPASEQTILKSIGLIATERTVHSPYLQRLKEGLPHPVEIHPIIGSSLISFIEETYPLSSDEEIHNAISPYIEVINALEIDQLVLSCTHFTHIYSYFQNRIREGINIIDSREGIKKRLIGILQENNLFSENNKGNTQIFFTKKIHNKIEDFWSIKFQIPRQEFKNYTIKE